MTYDENELIRLATSADVDTMFIITPNSKAWNYSNDLVRARMAKRDKAKREVMRFVRFAANALDSGIYGTKAVK